MPVDSFKWLPPFLARQYQALQLERVEVPWTPLRKPIEQCRFALVTTAGLYLKDKDPSFDLAKCEVDFDDDDGTPELHSLEVQPQP